MPNLVVSRGDLRPLAELKIDALIGGLEKTTRRAYAADLQRFADAHDLPDAKAAIESLIARGPGEANETIHKWRARMLDDGKSPATINRALSSVRSVMRIARAFGFVNWTLEVGGVKSKKYRDTRGPGTDAINRALEAIADNPPDRRARDTALVRLLYDVALRRIEIERLDLHDLQLSSKRLRIRGKGRREPETITLPDETAEALSEWLLFRGNEPGPLFYNFDGKRERLLGDGIYRIMRRYSQIIGAPLRPHGLRHTAITAALDQTNGNMRAVQRFSRHRNVQTLQDYDDNRTDMGGKIAADVAGSLKRVSE